MDTPENNINDNQENENNDMNIDKSNEPNDKKPKISIKEIMSNKRVRYGAYASIMALIVVSIVIVLNLFVGQLGLKVDVTKDKMFTLSEKTQQVLSSLKQDVNIYAIYNTGTEDTQFMEMLNKYTEISNKIKIIKKDPNVNPQFIKNYTKEGENISLGSLIIESKDRFKILSQYDLIDFNSQYQPTGISLEPKVTGAIQYVTEDNFPKVYVLSGHNEVQFPQIVQQSLEIENYVVENLTLLTQSEVPQDASMLIITSPNRDYSADETKILKDYFSKGGKAIFLLDLNANNLPNYESVLAAYGVKPQNFPIIEGNKNNHIPNYPPYLIPNIQSHEITTPIINNKIRVVVPISQGIEVLSEKNKNTQITSLLTTSNEAYAKTNVNSETMEKETGDIQGPLDLAVLVEDNWFNDAQTYNSKIVVISSSYMLDSQFNELSSGANIDFFMNCVNFLLDKQDNISIRSKPLTTETIMLTDTQSLFMSILSVIVLPAIILGIGLFIWLRRKNR